MPDQVAITLVFYSLVAVYLLLRRGSLNKKHDCLPCSTCCLGSNKLPDSSGKQIHKLSSCKEHLNIEIGCRVSSSRSQKSHRVYSSSRQWYHSRFRLRTQRTLIDGFILRLWFWSSCTSSAQRSPTGMSLHLMGPDGS